MKNKEDLEKAEAKAKLDAQMPVDRYTSSNIRAMSRIGFKASMPHIISIATGEAEQATPATSIRAHDILGKWGMGEQPETIFIECQHWFNAIAEITAQFFIDHPSYGPWRERVLLTLKRMQ